MTTDRGSDYPPCPVVGCKSEMDPHTHVGTEGFPMELMVGPRRVSDCEECPGCGGGRLVDGPVIHAGDCPISQSELAYQGRTNHEGACHFPRCNDCMREGANHANAELRMRVVELEAELSDAKVGWTRDLRDLCRIRSALHRIASMPIKPRTDGTHNNDRAALIYMAQSALKASHDA